MFDGKTLDGWKANEQPESWKVVNGIITGDGPASHLFWMARECENCEFRAEVKLNHSGNSGMYFRTAFGPGFPKGYESQVENTSPDPQKTGSLYGIVKITEQLIQDDTWWTQHIIAQGNHIIIKINGKTVVDTVDPTEPVHQRLPGAAAAQSGKHRAVPESDDEAAAGGEVRAVEPDGKRRARRVGQACIDLARKRRLTWTAMIGQMFGHYRVESKLRRGRYGHRVSRLRHSPRSRGSH